METNFNITDNYDLSNNENPKKRKTDETDKVESLLNKRRLEGSDPMDIDLSDKSTMVKWFVLIGRYFLHLRIC